MKKSIILSYLFTLLSMFAMAQNNNRPEMGKVCKAYSSDEGLYVVTCRIGAEANNEVLIGINGVDHPWNGKIFKAKVIKKTSISSSNADIDYKITDGSKEYNVLTYSSTSGYTIYLKPFGNTKGVNRAVYNKYKSNDCDPEWLLTQYLNQQKP